MLIADEFNRFSDTYDIALIDRFKLHIQYPVAKLHWMADYATESTQKLASVVSDGLNYSIKLRARSAERKYSFNVSMQRSDYASFREIFLTEGYAFPYPVEDIRTMVDLGANIGMASLYFCVKCPNLTRAILVEANPSLIPKIERNVVKVLPDRVISVRQACVTDTDQATVTFLVNSNHRESLKNDPENPLAHQSGKPVEVKTITLSKLLDDSKLERVDLLKMDIEGAEFDLLNDQEGLKRCKYLVAEIHGPISRRKMFLQKLNFLGFEISEREPQDETAPCETIYARRIV